MRGLLLTARGDDAAAIAELRQAMITPGFGHTRLNLELARALKRVGRARACGQALTPAARSNEGTSLYLEIRELLARAWDTAGVHDSAVAHYRVVAVAWRRADPALRQRGDAVRRRLAELGSL